VRPTSQPARHHYEYGLLQHAAVRGGLHAHFHESGSGFGLGLALVRRIARLHAGEARCLERPGGGTRLEVELPG